MLQLLEWEVKLESFVPSCGQLSLAHTLFFPVIPGDEHCVASLAISKTLPRRFPMENRQIQLSLSHSICRKSSGEKKIFLAWRYLANWHGAVPVAWGYKKESRGPEFSVPSVFWKLFAAGVLCKERVFFFPCEPMSCQSKLLLLKIYALFSVNAFWALLRGKICIK